MRKHILTLVLLLCVSGVSFVAAAEPHEGVRVIFRVDDIGSFHAANQACLESHLNGIATSVEIMAPCAWFPEAVKMLKENPSFDVGVHLTLTSEWSNVKWRPLSSAPSVINADGYFYPFIVPMPDSVGISISESKWQLADIEREFRAQIELVKRHLPHVSHISSHMGITTWKPEIDAMVKRLVKEYDIDVDLRDYNVKYLPWSKPQVALEQQVDAFIAMLSELKTGTYLYVDHPAYDTPEMESVGHKGYENVAQDRQGVTNLLTHPRVKAAVQRLGVQPISYAALKK